MLGKEDSLNKSVEEGKAKVYLDHGKRSSLAKQELKADEKLGRRRGSRFGRDLQWHPEEFLYRPQTIACSRAGRE